jgi:thiol-disulfide isomerase/thioredoxin
MVFLHINEESKNHKELDNHFIDKDKQIFLLIFMIGCGPCEATKPHWLNIESEIDDDCKNNKDIIIADLDQSLLNSLENLPKQPKGFPTMYYITDGGKTCEDFDSGRDIKSFIKWIKSKVKPKQDGGNKTLKKHNKHNKKSKKSKKRRRRVRRNKK